MTVNLKIENDNSGHVVEIHRVQGDHDQLMATLTANQHVTVSMWKENQLVIKEID